MGRKAKIKKQRKQQLKQSQTKSEVKHKYIETEFVQQMQREGLSLKNNDLVPPEMPSNYIEPQI